MKSIALIVSALPAVAFADAAAAEPARRPDSTEPTATKPDVDAYSSDSSDRDAPTTAGASLRLRAGITAAPFVTAEHPETGSGGAVFVLSGYERISTARWVGARIPLAWISVVQPAGSYVQETAFGNLELFIGDRRQVGRMGTWALEVTTRLGAAVPTAQSGTAGGLMKNRALVVADSLEGFRDHELFVPGIVPVVAFGQLAITSGRWSANVNAKLPVLLRVSDADLPAASKPQPVGFTPVVGLQGTGWVSQRLGFSMESHAFLDVAPVATGVVEPASGHLVIEPALLWRIGMHALVRADVLVPFAGPLAGTTYAGGLYVLGFL